MKNILLFLIIVSSCTGDGNKLEDSYNLTSSEATTEISNILDEISSGNRYILKKGCPNISYTLDANKMEVSTDNKTKIILLNDQSYNTINYLESVCFKYFWEGGLESISCISRRQSLSDSAPSLNFSLKYGNINGYPILDSCNFELFN